MCRSALGFQLELIHPFRLMLHLAKALQCSPAVVQRSWTLLNDSLWSPACLDHSPAALSCAVIFVAARLAGEADRLPQSRSVAAIDAAAPALAEPAWWEYCGASDTDMQRACTFALDGLQMALADRARTGDQPPLLPPTDDAASHIADRLSGLLGGGGGAEATGAVKSAYTAAAAAAAKGPNPNGDGNVGDPGG